MEATKRSTTGSGLGMYIVKKVTEACHWDISFTSKEGKGTTFTLIIPEHGLVIERGEMKLIGHNIS